MDYWLKYERFAVKHIESKENLVLVFKRTYWVHTIHGKCFVFTTNIESIKKNMVKWLVFNTAYSLDQKYVRWLVSDTTFDRATQHDRRIILNATYWINTKQW